MVTIDFTSMGMFVTGAFSSFWTLIQSNIIPSPVWYAISLSVHHNVMTTPSSMTAARFKFFVSYGLFVAVAIADILRWVQTRL